MDRTLPPLHSVAFAAFAAIVALGSGCFEGPPPPPELPGRFDVQTIRWEDRDRRWLVYAPANVAERPALVLALPGSGQSAPAMREATGHRLDALAERDGFVVVYAEAWAEGGAGGYEWNDCRKNTPQPAHEENVGAGHTIPGGWLAAPEFVVGTTNRDIDAMDEIWAFFRAHARAPGD